MIRSHRKTLQVLDSDDADVLLALVREHMQQWDASQLADAVTASCPSLVQPPSEPAALAAMFAAVAQHAPSMQGCDAVHVLAALAALPVYRPDDACVSALLARALEEPGQLSKQQLYTALASAGEMGLAPSPQQLQAVAAVLA